MNSHQSSAFRSSAARFRVTLTRLACSTTLALLAGGAMAQNAIVTENAMIGNPPSEWEVSGAGDASIQGFTTEISVNKGETIDFKVKTDSTDYRLDVYRLGYYGGDGARLIASVEPSATLPQTQPACVLDAGVGLLDCGTWNISASWSVPAGAVSGIYLAKLVREDPEDGRASHIAFVVRDDESGSDILFQTSDTTWQAYNRYGEDDLFGGYSLYQGPTGHAAKVSYNRPFTTRGVPSEDWLFNAEYPMVRWLERNGYDVSYFTDVDADRRGGELIEHSIFMSVGHDEYWSRAQWDNVETARDAGIHLAFFSGNEIYWKVRWEDSVDGSGTPYRTLVCYKEGTLGELACGGKCDPLTDVWTGLWRDGCAESPPADGCQPENQLSGQISWVGTTGSIVVPADYGHHAFWRNTTIYDLLPGQSATLPYGTLGYEWNPYKPAYAAYYPSNIEWLSYTPASGLTHQMSLYRHASGALVFGAGTVQWSWGLDSNHDRGSGAEDARMQQATVNLFADMGVQPETLQGNLVPAVPCTPDCTGKDCGDDGCGGSCGDCVAGSTTCDPSGSCVPCDPDRCLGRECGDDGCGEACGTCPATDTCDEDLGVCEPWPCPCSIWDDLTVPANVDYTDNRAVELGVRFQPHVDGYITGVRYYKTLNDTGTHTGHLWAEDGTLLGSTTFVGETADGWQQADFAAPIPVTAFTPYIVSYHTTVGNYAVDEYYFAAMGMDSPPLEALPDGLETGSNGVYLYGASSAFPTETWHSSNYWADAVFQITADDVTPPSIGSRSPVSGASAISPATDVTATFTEPVQEPTISFELRDSTSTLVPATVTYDAPSRTATLSPDADLLSSETYTATVSGVLDIAGNAMAGPDTWSFTTGAPPGPPPDQGPGGPILIIADAANPFGLYFSEILRNEGFNFFSTTDISQVTPAILAQYELVLLGDMTLYPQDATMISDWVNGGGKLIASRPDSQLAGLFGLIDQAATLDEGYLLIDTAASPGLGLVSESMQFHGTADLYALDGAVELAELYSDATTAAGYPAVTLNSVGPVGGLAAAFTFDLARSVVYTRQGNPAWEGQERDGTAPVRSDDQFFGNAAGDPQNDWVDLTKVAIPQADEQQRLLANLIFDMVGHPWPRFWYLPSGHKAAVVMTGDEHGCCGGSRARFDTYIAQSPPGCSLEDWECIRASSYVYINTDMPDAEALSYHNLGFELGSHINTGCNNFTEASLTTDFTGQLGSLDAQWPSLPRQDSQRTHCVVWSEWASQADVELANGIRFDVNYYYWPPAWVADTPGMFTGSGMPMRFADLDGTMVDVYQATSQMTDESSQSFPYTIDTLLDRALGTEGYYGVFTANMHTDYASHPSSDAIINSAKTRGVPVVSGRQMLEWLDGRNSSSFDTMTWDGSTLAFDVTVGTGARNLRAMIPTASPSGTLSGIWKDTVAVSHATETIKGVEYATFPAEAGNYEASFAPDITAPVISGVAAIAAADGTATVTWDTNEPADSLVQYGTVPGDLSLSVSATELVGSHSIDLNGLTPLTTYYYRVTSADAAANSATEPPGGNAPAEFTTPAPECLVDETVADFGLGTADAGIYITETLDGELILAPAEAAEFDGSAVPTGWTATAWPTGGTVTVGAGVATVEGASLYTDALYGPGRSVEFVATFQTPEKQHAGFGITLNESRWAIFSTGGAGEGGTLYARTNNGTALFDTDLGSSYLGSPHRYRIDWHATSVEFFIDGSLVDTHTITITDDMRPIVSDWDVDGLTVDVDWMWMTPFAATGSFESRVYDAGTGTTWGTAVWSSNEPVGTSASFYVRRGGTAVPDGSWDAWVQILSSGDPVGGSSRYVQYRVDLATSDIALTPVVHDVTIGCDSGPDIDPPVISNVAAAPGLDNAVVSWNTNEPADSLVEYGTDPGSLTSTEYDGADVTSHGRTLTGLASATTYYYRVTSIDPLGNAATEPPIGNAPLSFSTTELTCAADVVYADFAAGTPGADTYVAENVDGEVILAPAEGAEFNGGALPIDWESATWGGGGSAAVSGGEVHVDGARANTLAMHGPVRTVEFIATFDATANQHVGFADDFSVFLWAMFSTYNTGTGIYARSHDGSTQYNTLIPGAWLGSPHLYRIEWKAASVDYYIDGSLVHTDPITITSDMRPIASDYTVGGETLTVDWMRMTPYSAAGSFDSQIFDAGGTANWGALTWSGVEPAGTSISIEARTGDTPTPDGSWSAWAAIPVSGSGVGANSRYVQYRANLASGDTELTPSLHDVAIGCSLTPDAEPPVITGVAASPTADSAQITWDTDEPADSEVLYGTAPDNLSLSATDASMVTAHSVTLPGLDPNTTYYYRVVSADALANSATEPQLVAAPLEFVTLAPICVQQSTHADFSAGTPDNGAYLARTADGEVTLAPAEGSEFEGAALDAGWGQFEWSAGGAATVSGGSVSVDATRVNNLGTSYGPGRSLEFVATFAAAAFQHVGFGAGSDLAPGEMFNTFPWVLFSTGTAGTDLQARVWNGGSHFNTPIAGAYLGSSHRYRIDWNAGSIDFYIDGDLKHTETIAISTNMRVGISDGQLGGSSLVVDWARMTPFASTGLFESEVIDGTESKTWSEITWNSTEPAGTSLTVSVRSGDTPAPDGSWTAYSPIAAPGDDADQTGRYLRYKLDLGTSDDLLTPELLDLAIRCAPACVPVAGDDTTCDGVDDDCDGQFDEDYAEDDTCGVGHCNTTNTPSTCAAGVETPCAPGTPIAESCDGVDNNCDGTPDTGGGAALCIDGNDCTADVCNGVSGCNNSTPSGVCDIDGHVFYFRNGSAGEPSTKPVQGVQVDMSGDSTGSGLTDAVGAYGFPDEMGALSIVTADKYGSPRASDHNGAVSSYDAGLAAQHSVGATMLSSNQQIAADVTNNGSVGALDASYIAQFSVQMIDHLPIAGDTGSDWKFLRCDSYLDAGNHTCAPLPSDQHPSYDHSPLDQAESDDFHAVLYGDTSGNWVPIGGGKSGESVEETEAIAWDSKEAERLAGSGQPPEVTLRSRTQPAQVTLRGEPGATTAGRQRKIAAHVDNADGILAADMVLRYDPQRIEIVEVRTAGLAADYQLTARGETGEMRLALFGLQPLEGSGDLFVVVIDVLNRPITGPHLQLSGQFNEGLIPLEVRDRRQRPVPSPPIRPSRDRPRN